MIIVEGLFILTPPQSEKCRDFIEYNMNKVDVTTVKPRTLVKCVYNWSLTAFL